VVARPGHLRLLDTGAEPGDAEAPTVTTEDTRLERLERLAALHEKGVLSDEELAAEKARVLGGA